VPPFTAQSGYCLRRRNLSLTNQGAAYPGDTSEEHALAQHTSRKNLKLITLHQPDAVRRQLKMLATEQGRTMDDLLADAINLLFEKNQESLRVIKRPA
jgi:hypothetical protein